MTNGIAFSRKNILNIFIRAYPKYSRINRDFYSTYCGTLICKIVLYLTIIIRIGKYTSIHSGRGTAQSAPAQSRYEKGLFVLSREWATLEGGGGIPTKQGTMDLAVGLW